MAGLLLLAACDVGDAGFQTIDAPPVEVLSVSTTVDTDEDGRPVQAELTEGAEVLSTASFAIRFNRFLLPSSASRQSVCLRANLADVATLDDCTDAIFLEPTYNPIKREITYRQRADEPRLLPGTTYKLTVLAPGGQVAVAGIRAFDGAPLAASRAFEFTTRAMDPAGSTLEGLPTDDLFCRSKKQCVAECAATTTSVMMCETAGNCQSCASACNCAPGDLSCTNNCAGDDEACQAACTACNDCQTACRPACAERCPNSVSTALASCAFASCHREDRDDTGALLKGSAMGLDLSSAEALIATAINKVAHQTQQGEHADTLDRSPLRFGRAMPLIDAGTPGQPGGFPGNSYLLYKIAIWPSLTGASAPTVEERERLRNTVVTGLPMPPSQGAPISEVDLDAMVTWIAQGAPTPACP
jgi:hypothetical protein